MTGPSVPPLQHCWGHHGDQWRGREMERERTREREWGIMFDEATELYNKCLCIGGGVLHTQTRAHTQSRHTGEGLSRSELVYRFEIRPCRLTRCETWTSCSGGDVSKCGSGHRVRRLSRESVVSHETRKGKGNTRKPTAGTCYLPKLARAYQTLSIKHHRAAREPDI